MKIIVDTREQLCYKFQTPSIRGTLKTGDYSIEGFEDKISIEKKELGDLLGCLTIGRDRFERELERSKSYEYFALVIESTLADIATGNYRSKMNPKSAVQSLLAFSVRYRLPVFFVGNRVYGARVTESLLLKYVREQEKNSV